MKNENRIEQLCYEMALGENILCTEEEEKEMRLTGLIRRVKASDNLESDIDFTISKKGKFLAVRFAREQGLEVPCHV